MHPFKKKKVSAVFRTILFSFFLFLKTDVWKPCHEHYHFVSASVTLLNKAGMCARSVHKSQAKILLSFSSVTAESTWLLTEEFKFEEKKKKICCIHIDNRPTIHLQMGTIDQPYICKWEYLHIVQIFRPICIFPMGFLWHMFHAKWN